MLMNPIHRYMLIAFGTVLLVTAAVCWYGFPHDPVQSWLIAVTLVALVVFGYDKAIAGSGRMRIPEKVLLALCASGGTLGVLVGMRLFRHKTCKISFISKLLVILTAQAAVLFGYWILHLNVA
jgi:uncharacterized membrane protein YsdA (DUF1294 family)